MNLQAMLSTHRAVHGNLDELAIRATEACLDCAQMCVACADACLAEESVDDLRQCIRLLRGCVLHGWTRWNAANKLRRKHRRGDVRSRRGNVPPRRR